MFYYLKDNSWKWNLLLTALIQSHAYCHHKRNDSGQFSLLEQGMLVGTSHSIPLK